VTSTSYEPPRAAPRPTVPVLGTLFPASIAALALAASVLDLVVFRGFLQVVSSIAHRDVAMHVETTARFIRNVAAVLLLAGVLVTTHRAMRSPNVDFGTGRRVLLGLLSGILLPVLAIALVMPDSRTTVVLVLVGILSGYVTAFIYGVTAFDFDAPIDQRVSCAFVVLFSLASLGGFVVQIGASAFDFAGSFTWLHAIRSCVEVTYFGLPVSLGIAELARSIKPTSRAIVASIVSGLIAFAAILAVDRILPADFDLLLYGALRLEALESTSPYVYAALFGLSVAGIVLALHEPSRRRLGFGAAFILLAGAGSGSPFAIAHVVFGAAALGLVPRPARTLEDDTPQPSPASGAASSHVVS